MLKYIAVVCSGRWLSQIQAGRTRSSKLDTFHRKDFNETTMHKQRERMWTLPYLACNISEKHLQAEKFLFLKEHSLTFNRAREKRIQKAELENSSCQTSMRAHGKARPPGRVKHLVFSSFRAAQSPANNTCATRNENIPSIHPNCMIQARTCTNQITKPRNFKRHNAPPAKSCKGEGERECGSFLCGNRLGRGGGNLYKRYYTLSIKKHAASGR